MTLIETAFSIIQKDEDFINLIFNLLFRWQDEKEYEDWNEYAKVMKRDLPNEFKFNSSSKRPFGVKFSYQGCDLQFSVTTAGKYKVKTY